METKDLIKMTKLQLFGGVLEQEITDKTFNEIVDMSLKEISMYYNATEFLQVPGASCIDLTNYPQINNIMNVYRSSAMSTTGDNSGISDPILTSQLQMYNFGSTAYANNWIYSYGALSTVQRIANTMSTDLNFREDKKGKKLYVNFSSGAPSELTIEYTPKLHDVSDIASEYWLDMLKKLVLAYSKIALGRIRTRYTQSDALWTSDGDKILEEGNTELADLREKMRVSNDYMLPVD